MNLQYVVKSSPNRMLEVERTNLSGSAETRYKKWLRQVTANAVEKALQLQTAESQGQSFHEVKRDQSHRRIGNQYSQTISPYIQATTKNCSTISERPSDWSLDKDCDHRRHIAPKIYALLVEWRSDVSLEWRAKVAATVHIFEEAIYRQARSKEEYTNPLSLDLQLRQVLRHFEAGNGLCLLQNELPICPLRAFYCTDIDSYSCETSTDYSYILVSPTSEWHKVATPENSRGTSLDEKNILEEIEVRNINVKKETLDSVSSGENKESRKPAADHTLCDAILNGQTRALEEGFHKYREKASKKLVKSVTNLMSKRKAHDEKRLKEEFRKAIVEANTSRLEAAITTARITAYSDKLKDLCQTAEMMLVELLERKATHGTNSVLDVVPSGTNRKRPRQRLRLGCRNCSRRDVVEPVLVSRQRSSIVNSQKLERTGSNNVAIESPAGILVTELEQTERLTQQPKVEICENNPPKTITQNTTSSEISKMTDMKRGSSSPQKNDQIDISLIMKSDKHCQEVTCDEQRLKTIYNKGHDQHHIRTQSADQSRAIAKENRSIPGAAAVHPDQLQEDAAAHTTVATGSAGASPTPLRRLLEQLRDDGDTISFTASSPPVSSFSSIPRETREVVHRDEVHPAWCSECMTGVKGAIFVPCGHTLCRRCSKEIWERGGNCTVCKRLITQILDIH